MEIKSHFNHFNINVSDLERSMTFYREALGLEKVGEIIKPKGDYKIVYLSRPGENFRLELTWLRDKKEPYNLGDNESHLAFTVDNDFDATLAYHKERGWVCFENPDMGIYFINDPDDYWVEIITDRLSGK